MDTHGERGGTHGIRTIDAGCRRSRDWFLDFDQEPKWPRFFVLPRFVPGDVLKDVVQIPFASELPLEMPVFGRGNSFRCRETNLQRVRRQCRFQFQ